MVEKVTIGNATLFLGNCLEILPTLGKVDAVITDPPYGINRDGKPASTSSHGGHKGYEFLGWDAEIPGEEVFSLIFDMSQVQIIWGANYFTKYLPASMCWLFWDKGQRISQSDGELAFTNMRKALRVFTLNRAALQFDGAVHPTQKPVALIEWCISLLPQNSWTILDPFAGSGTTGVACANLGRSFIGIEIERKYFDIACQRIERAQAQLKLFAPVEKRKAEQGNLF